MIIQEVKGRASVHRTFQKGTAIHTAYGGACPSIFPAKIRVQPMRLVAWGFGRSPGLGQTGRVSTGFPSTRPFPDPKYRVQWVATRVVPITVAGRLRILTGFPLWTKPLHVVELNRSSRNIYRTDMLVNTCAEIPIKGSLDCLGIMGLGVEHKRSTGTTRST